MSANFAFAWNKNPVFSKICTTLETLLTCHLLKGNFAPLAPIRLSVGGPSLKLQKHSWHRPLPSLSYKELCLSGVAQYILCCINEVIMYYYTPLNPQPLGTLGTYLSDDWANEYKNITYAASEKEILWMCYLPDLHPLIFGSGLIAFCETITSAMLTHGPNESLGL